MTIVEAPRVTPVAAEAATLADFVLLAGIAVADAKVAMKAKRRPLMPFIGTESHLEWGYLAHRISTVQEEVKLIMLLNCTKLLE